MASAPGTPLTEPVPPAFPPAPGLALSVTPKPQKQAKYETPTTPKPQPVPSLTPAYQPPVRPSPSLPFGGQEDEKLNTVPSTPVIAEGPSPSFPRRNRKSRAGQPPSTPMLDSPPAPRGSSGWGSWGSSMLNNLAESVPVDKAPPLPAVDVKPTGGPSGPS